MVCMKQQMSTIKKHVINIWSKKRQSLLFLSPCLLCEAPIQSSNNLCPACQQQLPTNQSPCTRCAFPLPHTQQSGYCGDCLTQSPSPYYDHVFAPFLWQAPLSHLIGDFKFNARFDFGHWLSREFVRAIEDNLTPYPQVIIPIPLHPKRLQERGFNQSYELAKVISTALNIPIDHSLCQRKKHTPRQSSLKKQQRKENMKQAFHLNKPPNYHHVALIDDVMTTGNTVNELSRLLKHAGVKRVDVWVLARAARHKG